MHRDDIVREFEKVEFALIKAGERMAKENESNAALHLSERVLYSPLTVAVLGAQESLKRLRDELVPQE